MSGDTIVNGIIAWILTLLLLVCAVLIICICTNNMELENAIGIPLLIAMMLPAIVFAVLMFLGIIALNVYTICWVLCMPFCLLFDMYTAKWKENVEEKAPLVNKKKKKKESYYTIV